MIISETITNTQELLLAHFETIADAPGSVARLRQLILQLAVQGRLVEQDPNDEPASVLLERIRAEKVRWVREGKLKKSKQVAPVVDDEQPFVVPQGWEWTNLAELGVINPRNNVSDEMDVSFVPMNLVPQMYGQPVQSEIRSWREVKKGFTHFAEGDVVLAKITPCFQNGKAAVMRGLRNGVGAGTTELHVFRSIENTVVSEYVYIHLKSPHFVEDGIPRMTGTAGQKRVPNDYFALNSFPLPPLAEQRRIVARVDALMALCDALEQRQGRKDEERRRLLSALVDGLLGARDASEAEAAWVRLCDSFDLVFDAPESVALLRQAVLQLAVQGRLVEQDPNDEPARVLLERVQTEKARWAREGKLKKSKPSSPISAEEQPFEVPQGWGWTKLMEFGVFIGGSTPSKANPEYWEGNIPWVSPKDMKELYIDDTQDHLSRNAISSSSIQLIPSRSILFVVRGMILAHSFPVALTKTPVTINQDMKALQFTLAGLQEYVLLVCRAARDQVLTLVKRSTHGTCKLNFEHLESLPVPFPPIAEQRRIVARVDQLMALCDALEAKLREERATATQLAEALCRAVVAGQPSPSVPVVTEYEDDAVILELPMRRQPVAVTQPVEAEAILLSYTLQQHLGTRGERSLGHVKAEKIVHLTEAITGWDLGRQPMRLPRGPADPHQLERAIQVGCDWGAFNVVEREQAAWGYQFVPGANLSAIAERFPEVFAEQATTAARIVDLLVPLKSRQAEAVATLYAVWNDLLRAGEEPDDDQIFAAFRVFHPKKKRFRPEVLVRWFAWMREHGIVPDGSAKSTLPGGGSAETLTTITSGRQEHSPRPG